jgi:type II secretory pathway pseudopilin PulG
VSVPRGTGLVELLIALALGGVVAAAAGISLVQHQRVQRQRIAATQGETIAGDVLRVMRTQVGHAAGDARVLGDTAVQLALLRGVVRACAVEAARITVPASEVWWSTVRAGDSVAVLDTLIHSEWKAAVQSAGSQRPSVACPAGGTRISLSAPLSPTAPARAMPVRIWHAARIVLYRASDGNWWLGERLCSSSCGAAQPVAGPLLSPSQGGFRVRLDTLASGVAAALDVEVRASVLGYVGARTARLTLRSAP